MANILPEGKSQFVDGNGKPYAGGFVYFYIPSTTTFKNTWQDAAQTILNTNPIVLDGDGRAIIFGSGAYRQQLYDVNSNLVWDQLVYSPASSTDLASTSVPGGAGLIGFDGNTLDQQFKSRVNRVCTNIAQLRTLLKITYNYSVVEGYYNPGDGGGGSYYYDASDTTSADNGGTIIVASDGGRWKLTETSVISVRQFGAKGDGVTNDTASVTAALAIVNVSGGGQLRFPRGTYLLSSALNITQSGVILSGDGCENTTLLFSAGGVTIIGTSSVNLDGSYVEGLKIKRSGAATGTGLDVQWAHEGKFMDMRIFGFSVGMNLFNAWVNHFYRCRWDGNDTGINCLTNSNAVHIFGGSINNNNVSSTSVGIVIRGCWNVGLHGVDVEYNNFRGVSIRGHQSGEIFTGGVIIDGCYIENNGTPGTGGGRHIEVGGYGTLADTNQVANVYIRNNIFYSDNTSMDAALAVFNAYDVKFNDNQHPNGITYATKAVVLLAGAQSFYAANNNLSLTSNYVLTAGATFSPDFVQTGQFNIVTDGSGNGVADFSLLLPYYFSVPWIDVAVTRTADNSTMGTYGLTNFTSSGARFRLVGGQATTTYTMYWKARGSGNA